jgi:cytochrome oxidase assembly protein ShyY1
VSGRERQGSYRFLLSARWSGLLAAAVAVAAACVALGFWQIDRLDQRHDRNRLLERNLTMPPAPVGDLLAVGQPPGPADQYARVRASGRYDVGGQLLVRTRPFEGQVGYNVLTPLVTSGGPALLVNRGWVPGGPTATTPPDPPRPPAGMVTVTGRLRPSEPPSTTGTPPPGQVTRIDVPAIAGSLGYEVYGGYVDLVRERPRPTVAPELLPAPEPSEGPHLAYAFQWFLFGGLALGGYVVLARREAADRAAADPRASDAGRDASGDVGRQTVTGR